jgi:general secretion pathway protein D
MRRKFLAEICAVLAFILLAISSTPSFPQETKEGGSQGAGQQQEEMRRTIGPFRTPRVIDGFPGPSREAEGATIDMNFKDADIDQVLKFVSEVTGLTIVKDDRVKGNITVINLRRLTRDEVLNILTAVLEVKGFAMVRTDRVIKVVPMESAKGKKGPVSVGPQVPPVKPEDTLVTLVVPLKYADANLLKNTISSFVSQPSSVVADTRTNTLIISDTAANLERVSKIIEQLDINISKEIKIKIFPLSYTDASEVAANLEKLFSIQQVGQQIQKPRQEGGPQPQPQPVAQPQPSAGELTQLKSQIRVVADTRTNSIIVAASDENLELVEKILKELEGLESKNVEVKVIPLKRASAQEVSNILNELITGTSMRTTQQRRRIPEEWLRMQQQQAGGIKGLTGPVSVSYDTRTNSIIVASSPSNFPVIEELVNQLDRQVEGMGDTKVYTLKYADATELASALQDLFSGMQTRSGGAPFFFWMMGQQVQAGRLTGQIQVVAYPRTNSIMVSLSNPEYFAFIDKLIQDLDTKAPEWVDATMVYKVQYGDAQKLAQLLNQLLSGGGGMGFFTLLTRGRTSTSNLIGNVRVSADTTTNSLVITTSAQNFEIIKKVLDQLDQPRPQVLIQVLIAEVSLTEDTKLGVEFSWENLIHFNESEFKGQGGYKWDSGSTADTSLGLRYSILDDKLNINLLIQLLKKDTRVNVLSAPSTIVSDNSQATVNVGQEVPYITGTQITQYGGVSYTYNYRTVGITLNVTPRINGNGDVDLDVTQEINELIEFTSFNAPVVSTRKVQTQLTVRSGGLAVIGGLMKNNKKQTEYKIPLLGDVPYLGAFFRKKQETVEKTELLVFISPTVIRTPEEMKSITDKEKEKIKEKVPELKLNDGNEGGTEKMTP